MKVKIHFESVEEVDFPDEMFNPREQEFSWEAPFSLTVKGLDYLYEKIS